MNFIKILTRIAQQKKIKYVSNLNYLFCRDVLIQLLKNNGNYTELLDIIESIEEEFSTVKIYVTSLEHKNILEDKLQHENIIFQILIREKLPRYNSVITDHNTRIFYCADDLLKIVKPILFLSKNIAIAINGEDKQLSLY